VHVVDIFREEGDASGGSGNIFQSAHGLLAVLAIFVTEQANRVDHHVGFLNFAQGFFQRVAADVVFTVGDDEQNLFVLVAFFQVIEGADNRVVESGAAAGINTFEGFLKFGNTAGEIFVEIEVVVVIEVDDERFILRIGGLNESECSGVDARTFVAHGAAVVDDQAHADGDILAFEDGEFLLGFVFEDAEVFFFETFGEFATVVKNGGVEHDEIDVHANGAALAIGLLGRIGGLRIWQRSGALLRVGNRGGKKQRYQGEKKQSTGTSRTVSGKYY